MAEGKQGIVVLTRAKTIKVSVEEDPASSQIINVEEISETGARVTAAQVNLATTHNSAAKKPATQFNLATTQNAAAKLAATQLNLATTHDSAASKMAGTYNLGDLAEPAKVSKVYFGKGVLFWVLMISCSFILLVGTSSATLLGRLYFIHGGSQRWLYTFIQSAGWPILLPPLCAYYLVNSHSFGRPTPFTFKLFAIYSAMGFFTTLDNLLFSWGLSYLPVSTNALLCASQLAFNAMFSYAIVGQKLTQYIVNCIFAITVGAVLLGLHSSSDRPATTTQKQYILGFVFTIGGAALYALMLPLMELIYKKVIGRTNFAVVLEAQISIAIFATLFSLMGMGINGEFGALKEEAKSFSLGPSLYIVTLVGSAIGWEMFFLGGAGIVFLASSLLSCVFVTAMLPLLSILAIIFFHDNFSPLKGIAMLLSIWGFLSYVYGGYLDFKSQCVVEPERDPLENV